MTTTVQQWNALYPIGTPVIAYPACRPEDDPADERLVTRTRSHAELLGGHTPVVWVDGHGACIALTHVDPAEPDGGCRQVRDQLLTAAATPGTNNGSAA